MTWPPPKMSFDTSDMKFKSNLYEMAFLNGMMLCSSRFDIWYAEHIQSLADGRCDVSFEQNGNKLTLPRVKIFNIQPIKEETAEDLLEEFMNNWQTVGDSLIPYAKKVKAFLERQK